MGLPHSIAGWFLSWKILGGIPMTWETSIWLGLIKWNGKFDEENDIQSIRSGYIYILYYIYIYFYYTIYI